MLKIITGRSGSGKTDEMLALMRECENAIYIVPEQYSFAAEKKITHAFGVSGMGNPNVFSFRRLAHFFEEMYGGNTSVDISSAGKVMVLGDIVKKLSGDLTLYGGSARRGEMASESAVIVTTFKQYAITGEKIEEAMKKTKNSLLYKKLSDCRLICEAYDAFLKEGYRDGDDLLEGLRKNIERTEYLCDKEVFIDSFQAFTPLEYAVLAQMLSKCKNVTVSLCEYEGGDEFTTAKRTKMRLIDLAKEIGVAYGGETKMSGSMYTACDELKVLEKSFFEDEEEIWKSETDRINIHRAKNEYTEAEHAAALIEALCRDEGYRYRDIVIVAREMGDYERNLSRVFEKFNIPLFMDKKTPLSAEAAAVFLLSAIKIVSRGWRSETVFGFMKTAFSPIEPEAADELENYCLAAGIKARDWKSGEDWDMSASIKNEEADEGYIARINESRRRLAAPILNLEKKIKGKHTGRELSVAFYEFMEECCVWDKINETANRLTERGEGEAAQRMRQVYDLMIGILESFDNAFGGKTLSPEEFMTILASGLESVEIGVIPATTDAVCAGSIDRARGHGAKVVIILGAAEGKFPLAPKETGIFTNADRKELLSYGIELPPDTLGKVYMEESLVYSALTCATDKLYVSYSLGKEGAAPSDIIKRLYRVFPKCNVTDELCSVSPMERIGSAQSTFSDFALEYARMIKGEDAADEWHTALEFYRQNPLWRDKIKGIEKHTAYENKTELVKAELLGARYGREMNTSVSRLEQYVKCPFSYFASVTLGLSERRELEVTAADSGTFLHEFVDLFGKGLKDDGKTWRDIDSVYIDKKTEEITMSLLSGLNRHLLETSPRVRNLFVQLKRIAKRSVTVLSEHMKKGAFEPLGYEIVFDKNGDFKPVTITLPNGQKALLRGRVDRADVLETSRGKFVRIIDYKSGEKKFSLSNIYHGFDLQLAMYLTAICENGDYRPAGMLYFKIDDPVIDAPCSIADDYVQNEIVKKLKMDGLVLADDEILEAMDKGYAQGSSVVPVKKKKDGSFTEASRIATEGEFASISRHVKSTVKKLVSEILSGYNSIAPVKGACEWCEMKSLCGFDTTLKGCSYKGVDKINDKEALLKMIEEETGDS